MRRVIVRDRDRIVELSTMDFLRVLQAERRIQSVDQIFERARAAGRDASRIETLPHPIPAIDEETRNLIRR